MEEYYQQICWLQKILNTLGCSFLDRFFLTWDHVDSFGFLVFAILLVWFFVGREIGIKFFYLILLSGAINTALKIYFQEPRPCQLFPNLGLVCPNEFGFPSGAAQSAMIFLGLTFIETSKKWYRFLICLYFILLSFSRVYLGAHFFTDILGGWFIGVLLVLLYWKVFPKSKKNWMIWVFSVPFILIAISQTVLSIYLGLSIGIGLGILFTQKRKRHELNFTQKFILAALSLIGVFICHHFYLKYPSHSLLIGFIAGYWVSYFTDYRLQKWVRKLS